MYSWISALTRRLPPAVKKLSDNKSCHRVNGGEVQKRAYANRAFLIACVRVHYADERGIKTKNKQEICTSYASRVPRHASHSWNQREHKLIICRALGGKHRMRLKAGTQAPRLFLPELNTNLTIKKKNRKPVGHIMYSICFKDLIRLPPWHGYHMAYSSCTSTHVRFKTVKISIIV